MAKEKEDYRENMAMLNARFPDKDALTVSDVCQVTGLCDKTVKKRVSFVGKPMMVSKASLARQISIIGSAACYRQRNPDIGGRKEADIRSNIEMLNARFPEKDMLTITDVCAVFGKSYRVVRRNVLFDQKTKLVSKASLARQISVC